MLLHIANLAEADRRTVVAGEDLALGAVVIASENGTTGARKVMLITAATELKKGVAGVAWKVSADADQVTSSTANTDSSADLGSRIVTISEGDLIVQVRKGAIMHYDVSLLHSSLDPARAGTLPSPGDALAIDATTGLFCKADVVGAFTSPVFGVCYETFGTTKVRIELQDVA